MRRIFTVLALLATACTAGKDVPPPAPYGAIPTPEQTEWQKMEYYMFIHFGPNTFTDVEWGDGTEDPAVFNPTDLDCRQWVETARDAGMRGVIITAKHHDGFCLWPSAHSTHTVRQSPWRDGKGDVLRELSDACREAGIEFGVYLSPWDQNHPSYGTPEYNGVFASTLEEVLSGYGPVFEQWFDGANGGANVPAYDWELFNSVVYRHQPHAVIFSDVGPGCRWVGNETGTASETNWSTLNVAGFTPGHGAPPVATLGAGTQGGAAWVPAEADVSIRPGWFYSPSTDDEVKSVDHLMDIYYNTVGRNANLLLNVPPDRRGRIHPNDSLRLMEFRAAREEAFGVDILTEGRREGKDAVKVNVKAGNERGGSRKYSAENLIDGNYETWWTTDDEATELWIEFDLGEEKTFDRLMLQEYIPLGQRVMSFTVKYLEEDDRQDKSDSKGFGGTDVKGADNVSGERPDSMNDKEAGGPDGKWKVLARATTIGYKRILRLPVTTACKIRIELEAAACPVISTIALYDAPDSEAK